MITTSDYRYYQALRKRGVAAEYKSKQEMNPGSVKTWTGNERKSAWGKDEKAPVNPKFGGA
ncbi:MAG: hypothetical protein Kapaf2KO_23880 [Candidatus Kapaibacteriales bacterium]